MQRKPTVPLQCTGETGISRHVADLIPNCCFFSRTPPLFHSSLRCASYSQAFLYVSDELSRVDSRNGLSS